MILGLSNITKSFGTDEVLKDVTFQIEEKEKVALVGANGGGKTTIINIIIGNLSYDSGEMIRKKDLSLGYLSQNMGLDDENTIYEEGLTCFLDFIKMEQELRNLEKNLSTGDETLLRQYDILQHKYHTSDKYGYENRIKAVLKGFGFSDEDFTKKVNTLSGGQKTRVALMKLLLKEPELLILDEPTNHLDMASVEWLEGYLKTYKGAVLLVSHDRFFLDSVTAKTVFLGFGKTRTYKGSYTAASALKDKEDEDFLKQYENQQKELLHHQAVITKLKQFNREKSLKRARSREKLVNKIDLIDKPESIEDTMRLSFMIGKESGFDVLSIKDLAVGYDGKAVQSGINLDIKKGDRIALLGPNGIGKTTLFKTIEGTLTPIKSEIKYGSNVKIGYYDQEQKELSFENTILEELCDEYPTLKISQIRNILALFMFKGEDIFKTVDMLSGGECGRVSLAKLFLTGANFLLLDEPTNHLDLQSKEILEKALLSYEGTILFISHDRYFINKISTKVMEMHEDGSITVFDGNYEYYLEKKSIKGTIKEAAKEVSVGKETYIKNKEREAKERKRLKDMEKCEKEIARLENEIKTLDDLLLTPEIATNPDKAADTFHLKEEKEMELLSFYKEWEELSDEGF